MTATTHPMTRRQTLAWTALRIPFLLARVPLLLMRVLTRAGVRYVDHRARRRP